MNLAKSLVAGALCAPLLAGCAHDRAGQPVPIVAQPALPGPALGQVVHVDREQRYVIVECTALPSTGEVIRVYRSEQAVGRVRVTGPVDNVFVACDTLDGDVRMGDKVRR